MAVSRARRGVWVGLLLVGLAGCATTAPSRATAGSSTVVNVVAAENFWGSLAAQLGG